MGSYASCVAYLKRRRCNFASPWATAQLTRCGNVGANGGSSTLPPARG